MKNRVGRLFFLGAVLSTLSCFGQAEVEMADTMRSEGKIYVVVAIVIVILLGLVGYLFLTDRKVTRLEEKMGNK